MIEKIITATVFEILKIPLVDHFPWSTGVFSQEGCRLGHTKVVATK